MVHLEKDQTLLKCIYNLSHYWWRKCDENEWEKFYHILPALLVQFINTILVWDTQIGFEGQKTKCDRMLTECFFVTEIAHVSVGE